MVLTFQQVFNIDMDDFRALRGDNAALATWLIAYLTFPSPINYLDKLLKSEDLSNTYLFDLIQDLSLRCVNFPRVITLYK